MQFLDEATSPARVNQHFSGAYPVSVDCKNEYIAGLEAISAWLISPVDVEVEDAAE